MNPAVVIPVLLVAGAALVMHSWWQRRELVARLRRAWGVPLSPRRLDDDDAAEAWEELERGRGFAQGLDDRTWSDLDLDAVLATIDRTHTGLGRQMLYRRLRAATAWSDTPHLEQLAQRLGRDQRLREQVGVQLHSAGRSLGGGLWVITRPDLIQVRWWYWFFPLLSGTMIASAAVSPFEPRALLVVGALAVINLVVRMATAWQIPGLLAPIRQMGPLIRTAERLVRVPGMRDDEGDLVAREVKRLRPLRRIASWVSRDPVSSGEIVAGVYEYLNLLLVLDANALLLSAHHLRRLAPVLERVATWVGDVDVALTVASLRAEPRSWVVPRWTEETRTELAGVWHPLIEVPVGNDATLQGGVGMVITGANMSGKTTYLRSIGIATVLARSLNTCPATSWSGRRFQVRSLIGRSDDLSAGKSYYQVEAEGVVELLQESQRHTPTIFLLDELLRGTNTIERLAAGEAVLRALLDGHSHRSDNVVIVATHDGELVPMLRDLYQPWHFRETMEPEGLTFDYRRRQGPASSRTALALLEVAGAPPAVVTAARRRATELDEAQEEATRGRA